MNFLNGNHMIELKYFSGIIVVSFQYDFECLYPLRSIETQQ
jgi:hypothetical protein